MSGDNDVNQVGAESDRHPAGLKVLFGAEMFERVCYYGMRGLLTLYLTKALLMGDKEAFLIYGAYTALVYAAPVAGGKLADMVLGYRRAVIFGAIMMALGEFMILGGNEFFLFAGMGLIIVGNGFFKANISTIVGRLYKDGDPKRDSGFTIFYMGINLGALLAVLPVIGIAPVGERFGFGIGFGLAGVGMILGLTIFILGQGMLEGHGEAPDKEKLKKLGPIVYVGSVLAAPVLFALLRYGPKIEDPIIGQNLLFWLLLGTLVYVVGGLLVEGFKGDKVQRDRILVLMILMVFNVVFWACFEQAGSSLTLFADRNVDRTMGSFTLGASATQFFNPAFILLFGSVFTIMWVKLEERNINPNIPLKFGLGLVQLGLGYLVLWLGSTLADDMARIPLMFLALTYMLHTTGELFLSPIGLSMVTKLAPKHMTGAVMGAWFLSFSFANYLAAAIAALTGAEEGGGAGPVDAMLGKIDGVLNPVGSIDSMLALETKMLAADYAQKTMEAAQESLGGYVDIYMKMGIITVVIGVVLGLVSPLLNKMMHGVK